MSVTTTPGSAYVSGASEEEVDSRHKTTHLKPRQLLSWGVFCNALFVILLSLPPLLSSF